MPILSIQPKICGKFHSHFSIRIQSLTTQLNNQISVFTYIPCLSVPTRLFNSAPPPSNRDIARQHRRRPSFACSASLGRSSRVRRRMRIQLPRRRSESWQQLPPWVANNLAYQYWSSITKMRSASPSSLSLSRLFPRYVIFLRILFVDCSLARALSLSLLL